MNKLAGSRLKQIAFSLERLNQELAAVYLVLERERANIADAMDHVDAACRILSGKQEG